MSAGFCLVLALGQACIGVAQAQDRDSSLLYRQDMLDCREGRTAQSRQDCELEARNALAEARRGALGGAPDPATQVQRRCAVFKMEVDQADCMARLGPGAQLSGSVGGGGVLREVTIPVPPR